MEDRHRRVEQHFPPQRQPPRVARAEVPRPPARQQQQARGQCEEQPALRDQQCERDALPRGLGLEIAEVPLDENLESQHAAIAEESQQRERAAPAPERRAGEGRAGEPHPHQPAQHVHTDEREQRIQQVDADGIRELAAGEDRIVRPEWDAAREMPDVGQVQREVAEIVRREHLDLVAVGEDEPEECAKRKEREERDRGPLPAAEHRLRQRLAPAQRARAHRHPDPQRCPRQHRVQPAACVCQRDAREHRARDCIEDGRDAVHSAASFIPSSGTRPGKNSANVTARRYSAAV